MENMIKKLQDILSDVIRANNLIEEGKEVPADRKLQGVRTKMTYLIKELQGDITTDDVVQTTPKN